LRGGTSYNATNGGSGQIGGGGGYYGGGRGSEGSDSAWSGGGGGSNYYDTDSGRGYVASSGVSSSGSGNSPANTGDADYAAGAGFGGTSSEQAGNGRVVIKVIPVPPAAPTAISPNGLTANSFVARWNASPGAPNYRLDVSTNSNFSTFVSGFQDLSVGAVVSKQVTGLTIGTTYYYRVRAFNTAGTSGNSNTVSIVLPPIPETPTMNPATDIGNIGFTLNWASVPQAERYRLDISSNSSFTTFVSGYQNLDVGNVLTWDVSLPGPITYYCRVRAENSSGVSGDLNNIVVTTTNVAAVSGSGNGLARQDFSGDNLTGQTGTGTDGTIDHIYNGDDENSSDHFSKRWTGWLRPRFTGKYRFRIQSDDGARLWINDVLLLDYWQTHGEATTVKTQLTAGQAVSIKVEYRQTGGFAHIHLHWWSSSQVNEIVPQAQLYVNRPNEAPTINTQPSSLIAAVGAGATLTVGYTAHPVPSFQWKKNGSNISGATSASLNLTSLQASDSGAYTVTLTNSSGSLTSNAANLMVDVPPTAPSYLNYADVSATTVTLVWPAASDEIGISSYLVYRGATLVGSTTDLAFTNSGLTAGTAYAYTVKAQDTSGNLSAASPTLNVTTTQDYSADTDNDGIPNVTETAVGSQGGTAAVSDSTNQTQLNLQRPIK
jgi:chitodextrinase